MQLFLLHMNKEQQQKNQPIHSAKRLQQLSK